MSRFTSCPECEYEVSKKARACPHCGNPLRASAFCPLDIVAIPFLLGGGLFLAVFVALDIAIASEYGRPVGMLVSTGVVAAGMIVLVLGRLR